jgi:hypothetical protein
LANPVDLTVTDAKSLAIDYSAIVIKLSDFPGGAANSGVDASQAFDAAIKAAGGDNPATPATILLNVGTYTISRPLLLVGSYSKPIRLQGAGKGRTFLKPTADFRGDASVRGNGNNSELRDITIDWTGRTDGKVGVPRIIDSEIIIPGSGQISVTLMTNTNLTGAGIFSGAPSHMRIASCNFYGTDLADQLINVWGGSNISITNCTGQHLDPNDKRPWRKRTHGRFFVGAMNWGSIKNLYIAHTRPSNSTILRPITAMENRLCSTAPLAILVVWQWPRRQNRFRCANRAPHGSASKCLLLLEKESDSMRPSRHRPGGTLTLDRAWKVLPDASSRVNVVATAVNAVIHDNILEGSNVSGNSNGYQSFVGGCDIIVDGNKFDKMNFGFSEWSIGKAISKGSATAPYYFNLVQTIRSRTQITAFVLPIPARRQAKPPRSWAMFVETTGFRAPRKRASTCSSSRPSISTYGRTRFCAMRELESRRKVERERTASSFTMPSLSEAAKSPALKPLSTPTTSISF